MQAVYVPEKTLPSGSPAARIPHVGPWGRGIGLPGFPCNDAVFHMNLPTAGAGAIGFVCRPDDFVVLPAVPVIFSDSLVWGVRNCGR